MIFQIRLNFGQTGPPTTELAALERLKMAQKTYNGENVVFTFSLLLSYIRTIQSTCSLTN